MSVVALTLNDACLTAVTQSDDKTVYAQPAFAHLRGERIDTGASAYSESRRHPRSVNNRFVYELNLEPLSDKRFMHLTPADLLAPQLEAIWGSLKGTEEACVFVVPAYLGHDKLAVLLGIAAEIAMPVAGLVDAALAATRRAYPQRQLVHIEMSLHATIVSLIEQGAELSVARSEIIDGAGLDALRSSWLTHIAAAFVDQNRFDPLHTADTEQLLLDNLDQWLPDAVRGKPVVAVIEFDGRTHTAQIDPINLIDTASTHYQAIADIVRAMTVAGSDIALQFPHAAGDLPGYCEFVAARTGGETFLLEPDAANRGALARLAEIRAAGGTRLRTSLTPDREPSAAPASQPAAVAAAPTHLLYGNIAYVLGAESLTIGSGIATEPHAVDLAAGMPGVSQRHCSLQKDGAQCVLSDHSRYGTYLNGNRIAGSTMLQVGDVLRVGTPGVELRLIRVEGRDAT